MRSVGMSLTSGEFDKVWHLSSVRGRPRKVKRRIFRFSVPQQNQDTNEIDDDNDVSQLKAVDTDS